jgi:hypothetical protein
MKTQLLLSLVSFAALTATALPSNAQEQENIPQATNSSPQQMFRCDISQETPTTLITGMVNRENPQPMSLINWSAQYFNSEREALSLCQEVSQKLQTLHEEGKLTSLSLVSGEINDQAVVCLESRPGSGCDPEGVLFTLDTNQSPDTVLYELIAADFKPPRTRGDFPTRLNFGVFNFL